jgi:RNA polymerase sigma-70 factor, ECF subfamily
VKDYQKLLDIELVEFTLKGDTSAFGEIIRRNENILAKTVKGMLGECPEAEDVGQETFINLYRSLNKFKGESALSTYIVRIGINLSLNELKKRKRNRLNLDIEENLNSKVFTSDNYPSFDTKDLIDNALQLIDENYRSVIVLRLLNGYSTKETAKILNLPIGTVLSRLSRGQEKMKEILKPIL